MLGALARCARRRRRRAGSPPSGITNQRETTLLWETRGRTPRRQRHRLAGPPHRAALRRADAGGARAAGARADRPGAGPLFLGDQDRAGCWTTSPGCAHAPRRARIAFGTVDSFLIWRLTGGRVHATDVTNASRTLLCDLQTREFSDELCELFGVPPAVLPEMRPSSGPARRHPRRPRPARRHPDHRASPAISRRRCSARTAPSRATPSAPTGRARSCS